MMLSGHPCQHSTPDALSALCRSFGFDPFGLGSVPANLQRFQEAELVHSRSAFQSPSILALSSTEWRCL